MLKNALIFLWQLFLLWLIYAASDFIVDIFHLPLPASVLGMMILFILLLTGAVKVSQIEKGASFLNRHLAFFFIPIAVGLMSYGGLIQTSGWQLLVMIIGSTVIGLIVTSGLAAYFSGKGAEKGERDHTH
ncbi:CidA/LrgA family protein [Bacillus infantis]|uniref:CidA/LrgA family protein n=1 Tax=Bacillus infantis TaxID=324767 RepID=UPI003CE86DDE